MKNWNVRKAVIAPDQMPEEHRLAKTLSWPHLVALGVGAIVGTGILTLIGVGAGKAGPAVILSITTMQALLVPKIAAHSAYSELTGWLSAVLIVVSPIGTGIAKTIPLWMLVGVQAFRLLLELAMHAMAERGIMPPQMTYTGRNFDIVTGTTAILVAALLLAGSAGRRLVLAWNILGLALLVNVVVIAILSTPIFRLFGDDHLNVFVTYTPFVWLPAVMVLAALAGHLLIFRALRASNR